MFCKGWVVLVGAFAVVGCGSDASSAAAAAKAKIGDVCNADTACADGLYCYSNAAVPDYNGQCTTRCTYSTSAGDSCLTVQANTACIGAGVCELECGSGLGCPTGTYCDDYGHCSGN